MRDSPVHKLSVVVPCFNEEGNIPRLRDELLPYFGSLGFACEFLFVDDGSSDQTYERLVALQRQDPSIKVFRHPENRGLGMALRLGFDQAAGDAIVTLDADLTFHPSEFSRLKDALAVGVACVSGSPVLGRFKGVPPVRRLLSRSVNGLYKILLGRRVTSTSSIFRLYRTQALRNLDLRCRSFDINAEVLSKLIIQGGIVVEVPVALAARQWGRSKIHVGREIKNHLVMFIKILWWRMRNQSGKKL